MVTMRPETRRRGLWQVLQDHDADLLKRQNDEQSELLRREHQKIVSEVHEEVVAILKRDHTLEGKTTEIQQRIRELVPEILRRKKLNLGPAHTNLIIQDIINEVTGYGPLEELLKDPTVTEIMVNNYKTVYIERNGKIERTNVTFEDDEHVRHVIERIVAPLGRRIDESSPMVDARLPDGSRVNAVIPPLAIDGPNITIRKFPDKRLTDEDLIAFGTATREMLEFLAACIRTRKSIVVSGGTGSGKTTLLNVLSNFIPEDERIITIEDSAELRLKHMDNGNLIRLESKPPNIEGKGEVTIRDLVKNSLRMRPDRIIVGECRGGEAADMLEAMNTGHEGSMTTLHANNPWDAISRLEMLVLQGAPELPHAVVRYNIAKAIDLIVQQSRLQDGSRKIVSIAEVGWRKKDNNIHLREIFRFVQTGVDENGKVIGKHVATGHKPSFLQEMKAKGLYVDESIFEVPQPSEGGQKE